MSAQVTLTVIQGSLAGKECVFTDRARLVVGRAPDCDLQLPNAWENVDVSRHHCLFEIDPPRVRVRDLTSRNGTFVNGVRIGERASSGQPDDETRTDLSAPCELQDMDEIRLGFTVIRVQVRIPQGTPLPVWALPGLL
jgi:eukaryotic-like serine/threonine-protein kinase